MERRAHLPKITVITADSRRPWSWPPPPLEALEERDCGCIGKLNSIAGRLAHKSCTLLHPQYEMFTHYSSRKAMAALLAGLPF